MRHYLQSILDDIPEQELPAKWQALLASDELSRFSENKRLFDFQQQGLCNAIKALWLYFKDCQANKQHLFERYQANGFVENLDYNLNKNEGKRAAQHLIEYDQDYPAINAKISFAHFINRISLWMATGSGKTLIVVRLIELLGKLITDKELPAHDILFLAHRDDLLEQFENHVEEFNSLNFDTKINLTNLRDYENVKRGNALPFNRNGITVFYYRSDLIADKHKEKIVDFRNYDNGGRWFILLDEAHRGKREDSVRQIYNSILSRKGFLFNFSATFTDQRDFATCAYNFNLSKFVEEGYGKHIYVSSSEIDAFRDKQDFSSLKKQKIVLKILLLLTYINKHFTRIKAIDSSLYHRPLLLSLVNSVNTEESDLELFFQELEKIGKNKISSSWLEEAKQELAQEFASGQTFQFEELQCRIDTDLISQLNYSDILKYIFNAESPGNIEVLKIPGNKQELIFRLMTAEKPFALIKIGDISDWLRSKLEGYEINESFDNESYFKQINYDDSDINILMGSRSFYEGWDSNRPNLLLFVNIGIGVAAKKFVLQAIGRGVRIEPQQHQRRRLQHLFNAKKIEKELFEKVKELILPVESLFVFGTNANNLKEIIKVLKSAKQDKSLGEAFALNPEVQQRLLLVPVYKTSEKAFAEEERLQKYPISNYDLNQAQQLCDYLGDKIVIVKYHCKPKILQQTKKSFEQKERYYNCDEPNSLSDPELSLQRIFDYFSLKSKELEKFKQLENEIIHFKKIRFSGNREEEYEEIKRKIEGIQSATKQKKKIDEQYGKISRQEYEKQQDLFKDAERFVMDKQAIKIKYLANHYYFPIILSESEQIDYLNHIINVDSEVKFIDKLAEHIDQANNAFTQFDWWMFSKIDHSLDEVFIPYYNPKTHTIANFKPDFIFWMQKNNHYLILFVDPKGTEHADAYRKIDWYSKIFANKTNVYEKLDVSVKLLFKPKHGMADILEEYRNHWFDNFNEFADKIADFRAHK